MTTTVITTAADGRNDDDGAATACVGAVGIAIGTILYCQIRSFLYHAYSYYAPTVMTTPLAPSALSGICSTTSDSISLAQGFPIPNPTLTLTLTLTLAGEDDAVPLLSATLTLNLSQDDLHRF